jgi:Kef-type K+ transport system membrane component KefB
MDHGFLHDVGVSIVTAGCLGIVLYFLRLPLLLGYLTAGIILGPHMGLGVITDPDTVSTLSEIGLILLMYILGMEIDLKKLMRAGKAVIITGIVQFLGCLLLGLGAFSLAGFNLGNGDYSLIYLAVAASLSSTIIVVKILSDRVELDTLTSRITLGVLVLQDLWAIAFLSAQAQISNFQIGLLGLSLGKAGLLILAAFFMAKYVLPHLFEKIGKNMELMLVIALAWCFAIAGGAGLLGLSLEMGALIAGICIASFPYHVQISVKVSSLRDFFVTLFFVALGLQIPFPNWEMMRLALLIMGFVILSRLVTIFPTLHLLKFGNRGSLVPSLNLAQISEFSLVILSIGVTYKHIPKTILSAFILALVIMALFSSLVIPQSHRLYHWLNPVLEKLGFKDFLHLKDREDKDEAKVHPKIVFLGFFKEASSLLREIEERHSKTMLQEIQVIDFNPQTIKKLKAKGVQVHYGDIGHGDTIHHIDIKHAQIIVSTIPDSMLRGTTNLKLLKTIKDLAPQAKMIVTADNIEVARDLYSKGADYVYMPRIVSAHYLTDILERMESGHADVIKTNSIKFFSSREEILS